jgi:hypothetical protein
MQEGLVVSAGASLQVSTSRACDPQDAPALRLTHPMDQVIPGQGFHIPHGKAPRPDRDAAPAPAHDQDALLRGIDHPLGSFAAQGGQKAFGCLRERTSAPESVLHATPALLAGARHPAHLPGLKIPTSVNRRRSPEIRLIVHVLFLHQKRAEEPASALLIVWTYS